MAKLIRLLSVIIILCCFSSTMLAQVDRIDRGRMRDILNVVSEDVRKNFYDPDLKKLDWKALTDEARQKVDNAKSMSEMTTAIFSLVNKLNDSHTRFLPPGRVAKPIFGFAAMPFGDQIMVYAVKTKGAAAEAGIRPGDRILQVNGFKAERSTWNLMMYDFRLLRPRSEMTVVYQRGTSAPQTAVIKAEISRDVMSLGIDTLIWRLLGEYESPTYFCKTFNESIGYMQIPGFDTELLPQTAQFDTAPKAMVIDLRDDGGGIESALLELAGHFESAPTTMGNVVGRKKTEPLSISRRKPNFSDAKLVVLVDSVSASAAEMLARHLQFAHKAVVVGDQSSGRVNSSRFFSEEVGGDRVVPFGVQIAMRKVVMADGNELEHRGVTPDVLCLPTGEDLSEGRDPCLEKAVKIAHSLAGLGDVLPEKTVHEIKGLTRAMNADRQKNYDEATKK